MKKNHIKIAVFVVVALILMATNPSHEAHADKMKMELKSIMSSAMAKESGSNDGWEQAGAMLGMALGGGIIDMMVDNMLKTQSFLVFSLTQIEFDGETKTVGFGLLGNVFISSEVKKTLAENMDTSSEDDENEYVSPDYFYGE